MIKLFLAVALSILSADAQPVTVFLVRHAEKAAAPADDPSLTPAGKARAKILANVLRDAQIAAVFSSQFKRTIETAQPVANFFKLSVTQVTDGDPVELRKRILANKGKAVLVSGHTNTVPELIQALGGPAGIVIAETEFDRLFVLNVTSPTTAALIPLRYGAK
jgi:phosphohistidine phosphatase SixA